MIKKMSLLLVLVMLLPLTLASGQSEWQFEFEEDATNPVIDSGDLNTWDNGGNIGHSLVVHEGTYYMFYTGISNNGVNPDMTIGFATSTDGVEWEKSGHSPIISRTELFDHAGLVAAMVDEDGQWLLAFGSLSPRIHPESRVFFASAPAPTGPWEIVQILDMAERSWDNRIMPRGLMRVGDEYRLYYIGGTRRFQNYQMGVAVSTDKVNWTLRDEPLLAVGGDDEWDFMGVGVSNPIQTDDGWELLYVGYDIPPTTSVFSSDTSHDLWLGYAYSDDGIEWTKYAGNPVINTHLSAGPFLTLMREDDTYSIYYDYRVQVAANGLGLLTGTITR